jgi:ribosomal protein S18 acetylase RimI-like enzyme
MNEVSMELIEITDITLYEDIWDITGKELRLSNEIRRKTRKMYVLTDDEISIAGISVVFESINLRTIKDLRAYISYFVVKPEYRNQGIGTQILHQIIQKLRDDNYLEATIQVEKNNVDAYRLYRREGFEYVLREYEDSLLLLKKL